MSSDKSFVEFICDQVQSAGLVKCRLMFGDYALYCDGKVVALISDNRLLIKPTAAGRTYIGEVTEAPPYPGAKDWFLIGEAIEDREWISRLVRITCDGLPEPKPKKRKS